MVKQILEALEGETYLKVSPEELETIQVETELVSEVDTYMNNVMRLFRYDDRLIVQEYSFDGEIFLRPVESAEAAESFIQKRLETYERMWDGCGCKIDFDK
jgi:hypothetical protein